MFIFIPNNKNLISPLKRAFMSIGLNVEEKLYQVSFLKFVEGRKSPMYLTTKPS